MGIMVSTIWPVSKMASWLAWGYYPMGGPNQVNTILLWAGVLCQESHSSCTTMIIIIILHLIYA